MSELSARLIDDAGAAAADPGHFFRSPEFLAAEGVTHTLAIEGDPGALLLPVIERPIPGSDGSIFGSLRGASPRARPARCPVLP